MQILESPRGLQNDAYSGTTMGPINPNVRSGSVAASRPDNRNQSSEVAWLREACLKEPGGVFEAMRMSCPHT
jgi:hypothetical protein